MQKPMTSEECQGYIDILNEIYAHGEQLREKVRKMHGDDAVLLIGEIMSLQQHAIPHSRNGLCHD